MAALSDTVERTLQEDLAQGMLPTVEQMSVSVVTRSTVPSRTTRPSRCCCSRTSTSSDLHRRRSGGWFVRVWTNVLKLVARSRVMKRLPSHPFK